MTRLAEVEAFWEKVCFDPQYQPEGRFQTYRDLVFEGMFEVIQSICPVIRSILSDEELKKLFWDFLLSSPPQSPVLRRLPWELSQFLQNGNHPLLKKYPWLGELMEYEYLEIQVRFAEEDEGPVPAGRVRLNHAHALGKYTWPVHFISEQHHDMKKLPRGNYYLFLWRDPKTFEVRFLESNALVAAMVKKLRSGSQDPEKLLHAIAKEVGIPVSDEYLREGHALIQDFIAQGLLRRS
jgi:hypothetical protein